MVNLRANNDEQAGRMDPMPAADDLVALRTEHRAILRTRHAQGLARLMAERHDLRGVHALADFVDDALRWTA